jgi:hypothetical protein
MGAFWRFLREEWYFVVPLLAMSFILQGLSPGSPTSAA